MLQADLVKEDLVKSENPATAASVSASMSASASAAVAELKSCAEKETWKMFLFQ